MIQELSNKDKQAYIVIRNKLIHGLKPKLKEINEVTGGKSPRSAVLVIERLVRLGLLIKAVDGIRLPEISLETSFSISTVNIPLVGSVTCGSPIVAEQNIDAYIPVSTGLARPGHDYFILRAKGNSMNLADIEDGDLLLVRRQSTAENGKRVVALIDDEATVKLFEKKGNVVVLRPSSDDPRHKPIVVSESCLIQGEVIEVLPPDLY